MANTLGARLSQFIERIQSGNTVGVFWGCVEDNGSDANGHCQIFIEHELTSEERTRLLDYMRELFDGSLQKVLNGRGPT